MYLIVGLGNPGSKYENTKHNIGFLTLDAIADEYNFQNSKEKFKSIVSLGEIEDEKIILLKPMTFMNLSGKAVQAAVQFFKLKQEQIIVIHDDLDIAPGKVKVKTGGGAGGHNGLKSIDQSIGKNYTRIRIGIGHPKDYVKNTNQTTNDKSLDGLKHLGTQNVFMEVSNYVLSKINKKEQEIYQNLLPKIAKNLPLLFKNQKDKFINNIINNQI